MLGIRRPRLRFTAPLPIHVTFGAAALICELLLWGAAQAASRYDIVFAPPSLIFAVLEQPWIFASAVVCVCAIELAAKRTAARLILLLAAITVAILLVMQATAPPHRSAPRKDNARVLNTTPIACLSS